MFDCDDDNDLSIIANGEDQRIDVALLFDHFYDMLNYDPDMGLIFASPRIQDNTRTFLHNYHITLSQPTH
jgi:truncated hemoglobin YjbI